jgi:hypothetical protein
MATSALIFISAGQVEHCAYAHHQRLEGREVYAGFGLRDITADVNFSDLQTPSAFPTPSSPRWRRFISSCSEPTEGSFRELLLRPGGAGRRLQGAGAEALSPQTDARKRKGPHARRSGASGSNSGDRSMAQHPIVEFSQGPTFALHKTGIQLLDLGPSIR